MPTPHLAAMRPFRCPGKNPPLTPRVGSYGWDGGLGTSARMDPKEGLVTIMLTHRTMRGTSPEPLFNDLRTLAYQAWDD